MKLIQALTYAVKIIEWLSPHCATSALTGNASMCVAGSIRRDRPTCNDIDIVCIPKIEEEKDMFGAVTGRKNHLFEFLFKYASDPANVAKGVKAGSAGPRQMVIHLPKCQLDLWYADAQTFATRLMCRTGSMQHNIWLAGRAKRKGWKWNPYEGILTGGKWIETAAGDDYAGGFLEQFPTEEAIYAFLDLPFIEPKNREIEFLVKNFGK